MILSGNLHARMDDLWNLVNSIPMKHPQPPGAIDALSSIAEAISMVRCSDLQGQRSSRRDRTLKVLGCGDGAAIASKVLDIIMDYAADLRFVPDIGERLAIRRGEKQCRAAILMPTLEVKTSCIIVYRFVPHILDL